ncbi:uncharacterized protein ColSpa_05512 [Colletotrichum spaethianum]|uniref:Uncharacterized protein n=1 Tax=Colletotrichum spaethianum TaxID=700344 RepID=A0AA37LBI6_9PEZI|nr:uncharacterized protein ColSpa_05512 [Colletotrichum spaethianum]GKT45331.1 hypothetical protein ColSpa_05512 [Colletotrichum spaethianum]
MSGLTVNSIPATKRIEYMRKANEALYRQSGPCPFAAFGTIIVNHTSDEVVCEGANFRTGDPTKYVYGTTIQHNYNVGWGVMTLSSYDVFQQSRQLPGYQTVMLGQILTNETDPLFSWQYNGSAPCPNGCFRVPSAARGGTTCSNVTVSLRDYEAL